MEIIKKTLTPLLTDLEKNNLPQQASGSENELAFEDVAKRWCIGGRFIVDQHNIEAVNQLFFYINRSKEFEGNLRKGICLVGDIGVGKTIMMKTLNAGYAANDDRRFRVINTSSIASYYRMKGDETLLPLKDSQHEIGNRHWVRNNICLDDIGREPLDVQWMGNHENVGAWLIFNRYELWQNMGVVTHFTTNITSPDEFIEKYGKVNYSRMKEMCNFINVGGGDRR